MAIARLLSRSALAALALTLGSASVASADIETTVDDQGTGDARVVPLSDTVAAVEAGESQWIAINWTSLHADARELKVTAIGSQGIVVGYPAYPVDGYSSGYWDDTLSESEVDYTALKISVRDDAPEPRFLRVTVDYVSDTGPQTEDFDLLFDDGDGSNAGTTSTTAPPTTAPPTTAAPTTAPPTTAPPTTSPSTTVSTTVEPVACEHMEIDSFLTAPYTFTFQVRNTTGNAVDFEFIIPDVNYELTALNFNGDGQNLELIQNGTDIVITGTVPAWKTVGGQQNNGFGGELVPTQGTPIVTCDQN